MKHLLYQSRLAQLLQQRNGYLVLASGLLILCLLLSILLLATCRREHIVITPPVVEHSFWVSDQAVSAEYLTEMTLFFASLRLTITADSAINQQQILLRYTDPHYYGEFHSQLIAEQDRLTQEHISTVFYPVDIQTDAKNLSATLTGDLISTVGNVALPGQRVTYQIRYCYRHQRLWVASFKEINHRN